MFVSSLTLRAAPPVGLQYCSRVGRTELQRRPGVPLGAVCGSMGGGYHGNYVGMGGRSTCHSSLPGSDGQNPTENSVALVGTYSF